MTTHENTKRPMVGATTDSAVTPESGAGNDSSLSFPPSPPPRIRTDASNAFAHHTMLVRVPSIIDSVTTRNPHLSRQAKNRLQELRSAICNNGSLPPIDPRFPAAHKWQAELDARRSHTWLGTDWFFAENYLYRHLADITGFWASGFDLFWPHKVEEYHTASHDRTIKQVSRLPGASESLETLMIASVFANRVDLSHAIAHQRGATADQELLIDDRFKSIQLLRERQGTIHLVVDNAGTELNVDLFLARALLDGLNSPVVMHVKRHPAFVSDAVAADVSWLLGSDGDRTADRLWRGWGPDAQACRDRLRHAVADRQLQVIPHEFWNSPSSLWELPKDLVSSFRTARLVILKGDAHYRRAVGDAIWPCEMTFSAVTTYFPAPLLALRTLKSDPIVGVSHNETQALDELDPTWRTNGERAVACLGGQTS